MKKILALTLLATATLINPACRKYDQRELQPAQDERTIQHDQPTQTNPTGNIRYGEYVDPTGTGRHNTGNDPQDVKNVDPNGPGMSKVIAPTNNPAGNNDTLPEQQTPQQSPQLQPDQGGRQIAPPHQYKPSDKSPGQQ
jgi:hypothetical protein